ncbi:MAG: PilZ domain-containing protein [Candidatus Omnitrophota bacterium]
MERRKYPRFELKIDAMYNVMSSKELPLVSKTENISAEGICFESDKALKTGTHVNLEIDLKDKSKPVNLTGKIKWSHEIKTPGISEKKFLNGVKLINVSKTDEGRFLKYYCGKIVEKLSDYLERG